MRKLRALAVAASVATLALLAGCGAGASPAAEPGVAQGMPGDATQDKSENTRGGVVAPEDAPGGVPGATVTQKVARSAWVEIKVTDVEAAATRLRDLATAMGGQVTSENLVTSVEDEKVVQPGPVSTMVIMVPADRLDSTLEQLKSVGTVAQRVISSEDVTIQVADVDSRIATLNGSIARLRELSEKAGSIRELTELEAQLTQRIAERDSLVAQQRALEGMVTQSPVTITLTAPAPPGELETTGFVGGLVAGWNALIASSRVLLTVLGAVLPFAAVVAVVVVPLVVWRRRVRRARIVRVPATGDTTPPAASQPRGDAPNPAPSAPAAPAGPEEKE